MAINVNSNLSLGSAQWLDARQSVANLDELLAMNVNVIPEGFEVYVEDLDAKYKYRSDYSEPDTGKWKKVDLSVDGVDLTGYVKTETLTEELAKYPTTEVADDKYVLEDEITVMSVEEVMDLIGLSEEELEGLSQIIDDSSVRIDKTNSSSYIYQSIQNCLADSKEFTLSEIAKASAASYKVVDDTSGVTDEKYIYLIANGSDSYDMYILDKTGGAVRIGETNINLSGYLTTEVADQTYVLKTVFDVLSGNIGDVANLATADKTVVGAINELHDAISSIDTSGGSQNTEISKETDNLLEEKDDGLFVGSETITISKADYDALSDEEKNNGKTYFVPDDNTTEDGTDLTQFAKISDLEETNNKIEAINDSLQADNGQQFRFAYDTNSGKYGYIAEVEGADTFFPFSRSEYFSGIEYWKLENGLIPKLTENNSQIIYGGNALANITGLNRYLDLYQVFNQLHNTVCDWGFINGFCYFGYDFSVPVLVSRCLVVFPTQYTGSASDLVIQGSNDNTDYSTVYTLTDVMSTMNSSALPLFVTLDTPASYRYWRVGWTGLTTGYWQPFNIQFYN